MNEFILAWVLITNTVGYNGTNLLTYSPIVKTLEDCQRIQKSYVEITKSKNSDIKSISAFYRES